KVAASTTRACACRARSRVTPCAWRAAVKGWASRRQAPARLRVRRTSRRRAGPDGSRRSTRGDAWRCTCARRPPWSLRAGACASRAGNAQASVHIGSVAGAAPGTLSPKAPLDGTLQADLASLAPMQPFLGTQAVVGGRLAARLRATGTLGAPVLTGNVDGDELR